MSKKVNKSVDSFDPFAFPSFSDFDLPAADVDESDFESLESEAKAEITEHQKAIREATANTRKSLENQWNTDFYCCLFFADQAQRDEFLEKAGALGLLKDNFINGQKFAESIGISLTPRTIERPKLFAPKKDWFDITL